MERWNSATESAKAEMAKWVNGLAPWQVIAHHTFVYSASIWAAQKAYESFMSKECRDVSYFFACEENPGRPGYHIHALWSDCESVLRGRIWERWYDRYGRNRIEPVRSVDDVSSYCSKYVTKDGAWWNVKLVSPLLFHRQRGESKR